MSDLKTLAENVSLDNEHRIMLITRSDKEQSRFPYIWLRRNQFFPTLGRPDQNDDGEYKAIEAPASLVIDSTEIKRESLQIRWRGQSAPTEHDLLFLRYRAPGQHSHCSKPKYWRGAEVKNISWFTAKDYNDPYSRLEILCHLRDYGLALIKDLPHQPGVCSKPALKLGPVRHTHFGSVFYIRSSLEDQRGTGEQIGATAANTQAPHSDEGWRHGPIGINLYHCIEAHPEGGETLFVDSIGAAEQLRLDHIESFEFLSRVALVFAAERNPKERFRLRGHCIARDFQDIVRGVRITDRTLAPVDLPESQIEMVYRSLGHFFKILYSADREYAHHFQPGEMAIFDNHRVLHARRSFNPATGTRWIQQLSIDREEFHNVFRQPGDALGRKDIALWEPDAGDHSEGVPGIV